MEREEGSIKKILEKERGSIREGKSIKGAEKEERKKFYREKTLERQRRKRRNAIIQQGWGMKD